MHPLIQKYEQKQMRQDLPKFSAGDTIVVKLQITEGTRTRIQSFQGVVIAIRNKGVRTSIIVRKSSGNEHVERVIQIHNPMVTAIEVKSYGKVRRSKLYYLRALTGKAARITQKVYSKEFLEQKAKKEEEKTKSSHQSATISNDSADIAETGSDKSE